MEIDSILLHFQFTHRMHSRMHRESGLKLETRFRLNSRLHSLLCHKCCSPELARCSG